MATKKDPAKFLYDMLAGQYKPLEAQLLKRITPAQVKQYRAMSYARRIMILDKYAGSIGL
jgi:hypothetical protein